MRWQTDVVLALRSIEAKTTALPACKYKNSDLTLANKLVSSRQVDGEFIRTHVRLADHSLRLNRIEVSNSLGTLVRV